MKIEQKNVEIIINTLAEKIRHLELELWLREETIKEIEGEIKALKGEINAMKGGDSNSKL